ncbi:MAG: NAD-dependent epimerase/dehydratase family protein [Desulfobacteraceae bacterium]|nr:MAG: NAD-dependent epimerase/dehydratase family protein [Desulfobacteraceae bacterium]
MNIAIFGGGGFIGSAVCDRLLIDGHRLRIFERPRVAPYRRFLENEPVEWRTGDMMSIHDVTSVIDGMDVVLHLVSTTLPKNSNDDPVYDVQTNLVATLQVLNAMVEKHVSKIIFISSGGTVYGRPAYLPIDENHPTNPLVSYGITKLAIEKYLLMFQYHHDIKAIILRVANPYGERQRVENAQGAVTTFIHKAIRSEPIEIWGDGAITRDYLYIGDVAEAFAKAIDYGGSESVFNIGSGKGKSLNEVINVIENILEREIVCDYRPGRPIDIPVNILDNSLARQELKWEPRVGLKDGIIRTIEWMRNSGYDGRALPLPSL